MKVLAWIIAWILFAGSAVILAAIVAGIVIGYRRLARRFRKTPQPPVMTTASVSKPSAERVKASRAKAAPSREWTAVYLPGMQPWVVQARAARARGNHDEARACYQRAAYAAQGIPHGADGGFRAEVADFARSDPRYIAGIELVRKTVDASPGVLQSELGKAVGDELRQWLGYVLYYAAEMGDIVRVKSGRSYQLYLPDQPIPLEPEKPKRIRAKRPPKAG